MTRYAEDSKERVRDAVDMVDLVETRTSLQRKGHNSFFGRCPFHEERTPSFHIQPAEGRYFCFGCGVKGDAFSFVMETEGMGFVEAMESLAERYGVELEAVDEDPEADRRRDREKRLLAVLERTADFYARVLRDSPEAEGARTYLLGRGLTEETLRAFRVGYAPEAWERVTSASRRAGYSDDELLAAGLAGRAPKSGKLYDRFRDRIIFPLADERGRVRGFGARAMRDDQGAKYLNSNENEVFHKGRQLFALHRARRAAASSATVVLAEGYTDVLALHQAEVENAVGSMGTALTEDQVGILARTAPTLVLALDADPAGQEAMLKIAGLAARRKLELRVVPLADGADPADLLASDGAEALRRRVGRSVPFVSFRVERILARADVSSAEGRDRALSELRPVLSGLGPSVLREELVQRAAAHLELSEALVGTLGGPSGRGGRRSPERVAEDGPGSADPGVLRRASPTERAERSFLSLVLALPGPGVAALDSMDLDAAFTLEVTRRAARHLAEHAADPLGTVSEDDAELGALLTELSARVHALPKPPVASLEHAAKSLDLAAVERNMIHARTTGASGAEVMTLAGRRDALRRELSALGERLDQAG